MKSIFQREYSFDMKFYLRLLMLCLCSSQFMLFIPFNHIIYSLAQHRFILLSSFLSQSIEGGSLAKPNVPCLCINIYTSLCVAVEFETPLVQRRDIFHPNENGRIIAFQFTLRVRAIMSVRSLLRATSCQLQPLRM